MWSCFLGMEIISPPLYDIGSVMVAVTLKWSGSNSWAKSVGLCCSSSVGSKSSPNALLRVSLRMVCSSCVSVMKLSWVKIVLRCWFVLNVWLVRHCLSRSSSGPVEPCSNVAKCFCQASATSSLL